MPMVCPSSAILFATWGYFSTYSPMRKKVAFTSFSFRTSSICSVYSSEGPSSKVRYMVPGWKYRSIPCAMPSAILFWYSLSDSFLHSSGFDRNPVSIRQAGIKVLPVTQKSAMGQSSRSFAPVLFMVSLWIKLASLWLSLVLSVPSYHVSMPLTLLSLPS